MKIARGIIHNLLFLITSARYSPRFRDECPHPKLEEAHCLSYPVFPTLANQFLIWLRLPIEVGQKLLEPAGGILENDQIGARDHPYLAKGSHLLLEPGSPFARIPLAELGHDLHDFRPAALIE